MPQEYKEVALNHPFQFAVAEQTTGAILFLGAVNTLDGPSAISEIGVDKMPAARCYDLQGRSLGGRQGNGILIENGRKVLK